MYNMAFSAFMALMGTSASPSAITDACTVQIPQTLVAKIHVDYPRFRPVRASDYSQASLTYPEAHGISCPGVAASNINGMRYTALFVMGDKTGHTLLLVAHPVTASRWSIGTLSDFGNDGVARSYVEPVAAGRYVDLFAGENAPSDYEPEPGRVKHYHSRTPGFLAGAMESTGAAYFFTSKHWVHLWLLD